MVYVTRKSHFWPHERLCRRDQDQGHLGSTPHGHSACFTSKLVVDLQLILFEIRVVRRNRSVVSSREQARGSSLVE